MPLKTIEIEGKTYAELSDDGHPVYEIDGKAHGINGEKTFRDLGEARREADDAKRQLEESSTTLKSFEGIEDPELARKALATVANLDDSKLVDAGKVEEIKQAAIKSVEETLIPKLEKANQERDSLRADLHKEMIGGRFSRSKFIEEKMAIPPALVESHFGRHFVIEDGNVVAKGADGKTLLSEANDVPYGKAADFDEALSILVNGSSFKEQVLKGRGANGTGAVGSSGNAAVQGEKNDWAKGLRRDFSERPDSRSQDDA